MKDSYVESYLLKCLGEWLQSGYLKERLLTLKKKVLQICKTPGKEKEKNTFIRCHISKKPVQPQARRHTHDGTLWAQTVAVVLNFLLTTDCKARTNSKEKWEALPP